MSNAVHKEFVSTLKEGDGDFENIIVGTYGFDSVFFEDIVLDIFESKDASTIITLVDGSHYENTFREARSAGVSYFIEPISHRLFHPKFILMTSESSGTLIISSANMTKNGLTEDGEIFTQIDYSDSTGDQTLKHLFWEMKGFLNGLVSKRYVRSDKHNECLLKALQVPWIDQVPVSANARSIRLLHNLDNAILPQIKEVLSGNDVETIRILSPFFDCDGKAIRYLSDNFSGKIDLYIQPDRACNVPIEVINSLAYREKRLKIFKINFKGSSNRYIHAKVILFETKNGVYCLTGSANCTNDALLLNSNEGNIELSLLRYEKDKEAFQYLLNNKELVLDEIGSSELSPNIGGSSSNGTVSDFFLEDARLEGNRLIVKFEPVKKGFENALLEINRTSTTTPISLKGTIIEKGIFVHKLSEEKTRYCEQSAYVTLTLSKNAYSNLVSNKRWISTEMLEKFPRKKEIRLIERTHGREGFITLLNRLDEAAADIPTMLLYYLKFLDFGRLAETLEEGRKKFVQRKNQDQEEATAQIYDKFVLDAKEVLITILDGHKRKFVDLIEKIETGNDVEEHVKNIFDFFVFIDKIVIWFISRKNTSPANVLEIIQRMKLLVGTDKRYWYHGEHTGYFQKLKDKIGCENFEKIYDGLDVLPHFILLSMIILELTKNQNQKRRLLLKKHLAILLQNACFYDEEKTGLLVVSKEKMKKAIVEYKEFENISFSKNRLREINDLLKTKIDEGKCRSCGKTTRYHINSREYLCPECAEEPLKLKGTYLALMQCTKCGYEGWERINMKGTKPIFWCPKDGGIREEMATRFYKPKYHFTST